MLVICEGLGAAHWGRVLVLGLAPLRDSRELRARVGVMIQDGGLPLSARAGELLAHVAKMYAAPADVGELSRELGITEFSAHKVRHLSGGMRQKLALAIALVGRPEVLFLDEPSAGLDPAARREVWAIIERVRQRGTTIILTSHLMDEVEYLADRVYILNAGRIIASGTVAELVGAGAGGGGGPSTVKVSGPMSPGDYRDLQAWAAGRGLEVSRRSLEDVFLDLTGRGLR